MAMTAFTAPGPNTAVINIASSSAGKANTRSLPRMINSSIGAALGRGDQTERHADACADDHRQQRHAHAVLGAGHDHRQHVPAELIGAEPVMRARRLQLVGDRQRAGIVGRPYQREQRDGDEAGDAGADGETDAARDRLIALPSRAGAD
jgi:hypothetical protein